MARGSKRGNPYRDANGRFASASTGRAGLGASRAKSSPAAARKAAKSQSSRASTLAARSSLRRSRAKLAGRDPADQRLSSMLSSRAQKAAVTRGTKALGAAKTAARARLQGASAAGTISKNRPKPATATATARPITQPAARVPAAQRPGSMTNILGSTLRVLAQADAQRIREIEAITGQKVRAPKQATKSVATLRKPGPRSVSGTLGDNLRQLAQSDARFMRGMAEIAKNATPKLAGGRRKKAIGGGKKALSPTGSKPPDPKPPARAQDSRPRLPGMGSTIAKRRKTDHQIAAQVNRISEKAFDRGKLLGEPTLARLEGAAGRVTTRARQRRERALANMDRLRGNPNAMGRKNYQRILKQDHARQKYYDLAWFAGNLNIRQNNELVAAQKRSQYERSPAGKRENRKKRQAETSAAKKWARRYF